MTIAVDVVTPPCAERPEVFQDDYLAAPPTGAEMSAAAWDVLLARRADAHRRCASCPLMIDCLYRAVVEVDVSGFVACTTEGDRQVIRERLGIKVEQLASAPYGTARVGSGPVSHDAVMAARHAHPKDTCQQLAERLGCSTSTIKRHLRRHREQQLDTTPTDLTERRALPTVEAVLDCFDELETSRVA
jgi:hypothetical protein